MCRTRPAGVLQGQPIAEGPIPDLVVVLVEDHEPLGGQVVGGRAEPPASERRVGAVVDERAVPALGEIGDRAEVGVVPVEVAGDERPQRVVEVVGPRRVATPAADGAVPHHPRVVQPALGDHDRILARTVDAPRDRGHDVLGARVEDRVDRVESQAVDAEVADPAGRALQHPFAHRVAVGVVVVDRLSPGRRVLIGEVRAERLERLRPRGADVVVDDVEDDGQAGLVRGG